MKKKIYLLVLICCLFIFTSCGIKYYDSISVTEQSWGYDYTIYDFTNNKVYYYMTPAAGLEEKPILFTYKLNSDFTKSLISEEEKEKGKIKYDNGEVVSITIGDTIFMKR